MKTYVLIIVSSYLLGSIPFGYLLVRVFRGEDVRNSGSGNIGATNVSRKSPVLGAATLVLDAAKGAGAVVLAYDHLTHETATYAQLALAALCAVIGHVFPVWLKFRGGKGVATGLGAFALLAPEATLVAAAIFLLVLGLFRYVSLGSVVAVAAFPIAAWFLHRSEVSQLGLIFIAATSLLIIARHRENIYRLSTGTERRLGSNQA